MSVADAPQGRDTMSEPLADKPLYDDDRIVGLVSSYSNLRVSGVECMSKAGVMFLLATMRDEYEARITESAADANELNSIRKVAQERLGTIAAAATEHAAALARVKELEATINKDWQAFEAFDARIQQLEAQLAEAQQQATAATVGHLETAAAIVQSLLYDDEDDEPLEVGAQLAERSEWTMLGEDDEHRVQICESHYIEEAGDDASRFFDAWVTATAIVFDNRSMIELPEDEYRIFRRVQREDE